VLDTCIVCINELAHSVMSQTISFSTSALRIKHCRWHLHVEFLVNFSAFWLSTLPDNSWWGTVFRHVILYVDKIMGKVYSYRHATVTVHRQWLKDHAYWFRCNSIQNPHCWGEVCSACHCLLHSTSVCPVATCQK